MTEPWMLYLCHACGWMQSEEQPDLSCGNCGEPRSMVEAVEVVRASELEDHRARHENLAVIVRDFDVSVTSLRHALDQIDVLCDGEDQTDAIREVALIVRSALGRCPLCGSDRGHPMYTDADRGTVCPAPFHTREVAA